MQVNKNVKKATETVLFFWRTDGTKMIERNSSIIEERKKEFADGELRRTYRDFSA